MEEHWTAPSGGTLLGLNRVVREGKTVHREYLSIDFDGVSAALSVHLFREPRETVTYPVAFAGEREIHFQNLQHERLTDMVYRRDDGQLTITLSGVRKGEPFRDEIVLFASHGLVEV